MILRWTLSKLFKILIPLKTMVAMATNRKNLNNLLLINPKS
jgi:hypothetical protein